MRHDIVRRAHISDFAALVASHSELVRGGISALLKRSFRASAVHETDNWSGANATLSRDDSIALIIINTEIVGTDSARALRSLRSNHPNLKVMVTGQARQSTTALNAIAAGAHGYLPESIPMAGMADAIGIVMAGHVYLPDDVCDLPAIRQGADHDGMPGALTDRQQQVLQLLARGASNKEIARELRLAEGTIKVHLGGLFRALGVHSRTAAIASVHARAF